MNLPFLQGSVMAQSSTTSRGFWGEVSPSDHVFRNTGLATGEGDGGGDSGRYLTLQKIRGSQIKGSWADFMLKHGGFNTQACHKAHLCELKDSKQSQRI